jgi:hypothetical protein
MYISHEKRKNNSRMNKEALDVPLTGWDFSCIHKRGGKPE